MSDTCGFCDKPLGTSASFDFCGEACQTAWRREQIGLPNPKPYVPPAGMPPAFAAGWGYTPPAPIITQVEAQEVAERILEQSRAVNAALDIAPQAQAEEAA